MKKLKTLLALSLCLAFMITTTNLDTIYEIAPFGHYEEVWEEES